MEFPKGLLDKNRDDFISRFESSKVGRMTRNQQIWKHCIEYV